MGFWWLQSKVYLQDRPEVRWVNITDCLDRSIEDEEEQSYFENEFSFDKLKARPVFHIDHRERRPLAMRHATATRYHHRGLPFFLASHAFVSTVRIVDPEALITVECDVRTHGREGPSEYVMADAATRLNACDVLDCEQSDVDIFYYDADGKRMRVCSISTMRPVQFRLDRVEGRGLFRLTNGLIAISDALADLIIDQGFLGICLEDATGYRSPPTRFHQYSSDGWETLYPA